MKNLLKNIIITGLLAWIAFLLLPTGSLNQVGIPMFIALFGTFVSACTTVSRQHEEA